MPPKEAYDIVAAINNHLTRIQKFANRFSEKPDSVDGRESNFKDDIMESVKASEHSKIQTPNLPRRIKCQKDTLKSKIDKPKKSIAIRNVQRKKFWQNKYFIFTLTLSTFELLIIGTILLPFLISVLNVILSSILV